MSVFAQAPGRLWPHWILQVLKYFCYFCVFSLTFPASTHFASLPISLLPLLLQECPISNSNTHTASGKDVPHLYPLSWHRWCGSALSLDSSSRFVVDYSGYGLTKLCLSRYKNLLVWDTHTTVLLTVPFHRTSSDWKDPVTQSPQPPIHDTPRTTRESKL